MSDVLTSPWRVGAWGDGSSALLCVNILCDECEVVVASDMPIDVAGHIVELHNACLVTPPADTATSAVERAILAEREACARTAWETLRAWGDYGWECQADGIAEAILARSTIAQGGGDGG